MIIIPAIDIKNGCVVRLTQGKFDKGVKSYSDDPTKIAKQWAQKGAKLIHLVDLDGASFGRPKNLDKVKEILQEIDVPLEFGGGVRSIETIKELLGMGVSRVVLGTKAVEDSDFLKEAFTKFKEKVIVSIDAKSGHILTKGWQSSFEEMNVLEFARSLKDMGFKELIYTDVLKDGMLKGPNIDGIQDLLKTVGIGIIASGGISSLIDIGKLKSLEKEGVRGVIIGKALYEEKFSLEEALKLG